MAGALAYELRGFEKLSVTTQGIGHSPCGMGNHAAFGKVYIL